MITTKHKKININERRKTIKLEIKCESIDEYKKLLEKVWNI